MRASKNAGETVKLLLSKGAEPSQITSEPGAQYRPVGGLTALLYAARDGCYDCVDTLIAAGADANLPTPEGVIPLMLVRATEMDEDAGVEKHETGSAGDRRRCS